MCAVLYIAASVSLAAVTMTEYKVLAAPASYGIGREQEGHKSGIMCVNYFGEYQQAARLKKNYNNNIVLQDKKCCPLLNSL